LERHAQGVLRSIPEPRPRITFHGAAQIERDDLAACEIIAVPSRQEPFGIIALEAMACGIPVVASDVGGLRDTLEHEFTGLLVAPGSPVALGAALNRLLSDGELRRRLGTAGRDAVVQRFTVVHTLDRYHELYDRAVNLG
jgi:glycosyltransferase involved in cell wall biosynthesis